MAAQSSARASNARPAGRVALIGAGRMGAALASGWLKKPRPVLQADQLLIIDPDPGEIARTLIDTHDLAHAQTLDEALCDGLEVVVLAVKPQHFASLLDGLGEILPTDCLIVSVAAGVTLLQLTRAMNGRPVVRAMPNTPGAIGKGVTVCIADEVADAQKRRPVATVLMKATGAVEWIEDDRQMGAVTALSGSGPAYVFLLCEALARAGEAEGLPADLAERLAVATVSGAGALLEADLKSGQGDAASLRRAVTSPGGTTQAALDVLMGEGGLPTLIRNAVAAAERRSRQLGKG
ncbi:MAG: pyrroline-5-carboxylate reductase [Pseudomonadota bacterium]